MRGIYGNFSQDYILLAEPRPRPGAAGKREANPVWVAKWWRAQANIAISPSATPVSVLQEHRAPPDHTRVPHIDPHKYLMSDH